jgi:hypothetical protein
MRAIAIEGFGGRDRLKLVELPTPEPGPDEVLVRVPFGHLATPTSSAVTGVRTPDRANELPARRSRGAEPHVLVYLPPGLTGYGSVPPFGVVIEAGLG